jgi:hypothetical protein
MEHDALYAEVTRQLADHERRLTRVETDYGRDAMELDEILKRTQAGVNQWIALDKTVALFVKDMTVIGEKVDEVRSLLRWGFLALGGTFITAFAAWVISGGLRVRL